MDRFLTIFMYAWSGLILLLNLVGIIAEFYLQGFSGGLSYIQHTYSPFNLLNYIIEIVALSPAFAAYYWRQRRRPNETR